MHDEYEKLKFYIELEKLRFVNAIDIDTQHTLTSDTNDLLIPNMIIQPLIENAIIHGLSHRSSGSKITIGFVEDAEHIHLYIEDNGIGIHHVDKKSESSHKSIGLASIKARIAWMPEAQINLIDNKADTGAETGTIVHISLPKKRSDLV